MTHRPIGWLLRILAWIIVALPIVRLIASPNRVWFNGRYAELFVAGQYERAQRDIVDRFGLSGRYPGYDIGFYGRPPGLSPLNLHGLDWLWLNFSEHDGRNSYIAGIWLTDDAVLLLPPIWTGLFHTRIGLRGPTTAVLPAGLDLYYPQGYSTRADFAKGEWCVWAWDQNQWTCLLRLDPGSEASTEIEFQPDMNCVDSIRCVLYDVETGGESTIGEFAWDAVSRQFRIVMIAHGKLRVLKPLAPMTFSLPKTADDEEDQPAASQPGKVGADAATPDVPEFIP